MIIIARPPTGKYDIDKMIAIIDKYTNETTYPILKEVCFLNYWYYDFVMKLQREKEELRQSIRRLLDKKEIQLEKGAISGQINTNFAIFTLKQPAHGWTDKPAEINNTSDALTQIKNIFEGVVNDKSKTE